MELRSFLLGGVKSKVEQQRIAPTGNWFKEMERSPHH